jgi:hypothetical protein
LTSNIHSSHDLKRPEAKRFRAKLANLNIPKIDLVEASTGSPHENSHDGVTCADVLSLG